MSLSRALASEILFHVQLYRVFLARVGNADSRKNIPNQVKLQRESSFRSFRVALYIFEMEICRLSPLTTPAQGLGQSRTSLSSFPL